MSRLATREVDFSMRDFSRGIVGGISERGIAHPNWVAAADNLYGRPFRMASIRPGSRNVSVGYLINPPTSLMAFYSAAFNKLFVADANQIHEITPTAYNLQTLPAGHPASSDLWSHANLNGLLVMTQRGGTKVPLEYDGVSWKELALPTPVAAPTIAGIVAAGAVDVGNHYYRVRRRHKNGSTLASPVSLVAAVTVPGTQTVQLSGLEPGGLRDDYLGWTLERSKVNGSNLGPWWWVTDGTGNTYNDVTADADLGYVADDGLHIQPPHFDGITAFAGRLWGWAGSSLQTSAAIIDQEATGIANWDPDLTYLIAKDDGDSIQLCIVVINELLILKRHSVHIISGTDPSSFVLTSIVYADPSRGSEAGCAGMRSACVVGGKAYFWGDSGGLFSYQHGRGVNPEAWVELGRYFDTLNTAQPDKIVMINHQGNFMLAWYPSGTQSFSDDQIIYDARYRRWWHWKGWNAADAIELKAGLLGNATLVFAGDADLGSFDTIAGGSTILDDFVIIGGIAIPVTAAIAPGTVVVGNVASGAVALTMSNPALANVVDGTFVIGGVRYNRLNVSAGSVTMTIASHYKCWAAFDGFGDQRDVTGTGGIPVPWMMESPWLDFGMPDDWKDIDRLSMSCETDEIPINISIATDPPGADAAVSLLLASAGAEWAGSVAEPEDLIWGVSDWAGSTPATAASGVQMGTTGRRFKLTITGQTAGDCKPSAIEGVGTLLPDKETDT